MRAQVWLLMKYDTTGIRLYELADHVGIAYGWPIVSLAFRPKGEASYNYRATGPDGAAYLLKLQETARTAALEARLRAVNALRTRHGVTAVVAPYRTQLGGFTTRYGKYILSAYPFIPSVTAWEQSLTPTQLAGVASIMATIHRRGKFLTGPLPRETFANPFAAPLRRVLHSVPAAYDGNRYQRRVRWLVLDEQAGLLAALDRLRRLQTEVSWLDLEWTLTHGDPNLDNLLIDERGDLRLVDWDEAALGPLERDLVFFLETDAETARAEYFLRHYTREYGPLALHEPVVTFYAYRWVVQEIADYTTRILFHNTDPAEDEHDWTELQPYLPVRHGDIAATVRRAMAIADLFLQ
ncbi:MAG: phosphotransferase enzyme family protein [Thermomicrobiales bacterium]